MIVDPKPILFSLTHRPRAIDITYQQGLQRALKSAILGKIHHFTKKLCYDHTSFLFSFGATSQTLDVYIDNGHPLVMPQWCRSYLPQGSWGIGSDRSFLLYIHIIIIVYVSHSLLQKVDKNTRFVFDIFLMS